MKNVIYTVATEGFSLPEQSFDVLDKNYEKICFTDDPNLESKWWKVVLLDKGYLDAHRESRRPKILPHKYLSEYDWSLYVDSSIVFKVPPNKIFEEYINNKFEFYCFPHPTGCLYKEAEQVILAGYDREEIVRIQIDAYRRENYPINNGLITGGMLLRKHNSKELVRVSEKWFEHVLRFSKRDQISFNFISHMENFDYGELEGTIIDNKYVAWKRNSIPRISATFDSDQYYKKNTIPFNKSDLSNSFFKDESDGKVNILNYLANKYKSDKGDLYYNSHAYAAVYNKYLSKYRGNKIKLLELGLLRHDVQAVSGSVLDNAPSISMWREYFYKAEIYGFDIADFSAYKCPYGVHIYRGDMGNEEDIHRMLRETGVPLDIIIDDASHASHHQQIALRTLFPYLRPGGFYFIEDLNYQPPHIERKGDFKTLDILRKLSQKKPAYSNYIEKKLLDDISKDIEFIHFFDSQDRSSGVEYKDSLAVIKKKGRADFKLI